MMCTINREFGVELEGYTSDNMVDENVEGWEGVEDGSLNDDSDECDECDSDGESLQGCRNCDGNGEFSEECSDCDGSGHEECSDCDGNGYYIDDEDNEIPCDECNNGKIDCSECYGSGEHTYECDECSGSGERYYRCENCNGEHYLGSGNYAVEFVSPRLENMDTFEPLFDTLDNMDWTTDDSCGTHIHVNGEDFEPSDVRKLVYFMSAIEPVFYGLVSGGRYNYRYCKILDHDVAFKVIDSKNVGWEDLTLALYKEIRHRGSFDKYENQRYFAFNLHSWFYRGSFEFRYFDGCEDIDELKLYVELCTKVVDFAKHATMEQLIPIVDKMYECYNTDSMKALEVLSDVIGLESNITLSKQSNFDTYIKNDLMDRYDFTGQEQESIAV